MTPMSFGQRPPVEGLTVAAEVVRDASPEIVELFFDIHAAGLTAAMAIQENTARVNQMTQAVTNIAGDKTELQNGAVAVWPVLQLQNPLMTLPAPPMLPPAFAVGVGSSAVMSPIADGPQIAGYRASSTIKVAVRDTARLGEIVDTVIRFGGFPNGNVRFLLREEGALRQSLLKEAVREAREKADVLASAFGRTAATPIAISEDFGTSVSAGTSLPSPFTLGLLHCCARVSVTYQLQ